MPTAPYPLRPEPMIRSWIERHPLSKIPFGCLILLLLMAGFGAVTVAIINASLRSSDVFKQSMSQAAANLQVREYLGEPIQAGWFISGQLKVNGSAGRADLAIPISGPRGKGRIRIAAYKNGAWRFTCLQVYVEGQSQAIDLLSIQPPPERDF